MRGIVLVCAIALLFVVGCYLMKKVDVFLSDIKTDSCSIPDTLTLSIAFEYSEDIVLIEDAVERMVENNPRDNVTFFYGTYNEIKRNMENGKLDIGVLNYNKEDWNNQEFCLEELKLHRKNIQYREDEIQVEPLETEPVKRIIVWRKSNSNNILSTFIKDVTISNC